MIKTLLTVGLILIAKIGFSCQCLPYEPSFYKNIRNSGKNCIAVFDTLVYENGSDQYGYFVVIDTLTGVATEIGDIIKVEGQNGINCGELLNRFSPGDTLFLALMGNFYLEGACGKHYLNITNGQHADLSIAEIKERINRLFVERDSQCRCFDFWENNNFYNNLSKVHYSCLAVYQGYDYGYSYNGIISQTGYFKLLDTIGEFPAQIGDTIVVLGEDGISCGAILNNHFDPGDTLFLALADGYHESFEKDTFYLRGGTCGRYYLRIKNGEHGGLSIPEIKDKIKTGTTSVEDVNGREGMVVYPNPVSNEVTIKSQFNLILTLEIYDWSGKMILSVDNINNQIVKQDLSQLNSGLYSVLIRTETGKVYSKKLLKN